MEDIDILRNAILTEESQKFKAFDKILKKYGVIPDGSKNIQGIGKFYDYLEDVISVYDNITSFNNNFLTGLKQIDKDRRVNDNSNHIEYEQDYGGIGGR